MALAYLTGSVTQGSADAFAQAEIATALTGAGNIAFRVRELLFQFNPLALPGNNDVIDIALSRRSKSAIPNVSDRDALMVVKKGAVLTTSGMAIIDGVLRFTFAEDDEVLIVEDPVYLLVDSDSTGAAQTVYCRIGYERVSISAVDRLTLLTQSLE